MNKIAILFILRPKTSLTTRSLDNKTLIVVINKNNKFKKSESNRVIKKLAKCQKNLKFD